jgi:hypothetical protein
MNDRKQISVALKLAEHGRHDEALEIMALFGRPEPVKSPEEFYTVWLRKMMEIPAQKPHIQSSRPLMKAMTVVGPHIIGVNRRPGNPTFFLDNPNALMQDLKRSPLWELWEKKPNATLWTTTKEVQDRPTGRKDLVLAVYITPKDNAKIFMGHLKALRIPMLRKLDKKFNYFDDEPEPYYLRGEPVTWYLDTTSFNEWRNAWGDPTQGGSPGRLEMQPVFDIQDPTESPSQRPPADTPDVFQGTVPEFVQHVEQALVKEAQPFWRKHGGGKSFNDFLQEAEILLFRQSGAAYYLHPRDYKLLWNLVEKSKIIDRLESV